MRKIIKPPTHAQQYCLTHNKLNGVRKESRVFITDVNLSIELLELANWMQDALWMHWGFTIEEDTDLGHGDYQYSGAGCAISINPNAPDVTFSCVCAMLYCELRSMKHNMKHNQIIKLAKEFHEAWLLHYKQVRDCNNA